MTEQFENLAKAINEGDIDGGVAESVKLVDSGVKPIEIFTGCIEPTLAVIAFARVSNCSVIKFSLE